MAQQTTTVKVTQVQADALRRFALDVSAKVGRRLSLGAAMLAAVTIAERHTDELTSALTTPGADDE